MAHRDISINWFIWNMIVELFNAPFCGVQIIGQFGLWYGARFGWWWPYTEQFNFFINQRTAPALSVRHSNGDEGKAPGGNPPRLCFFQLSDESACLLLGLTAAKGAISESSLPPMRSAKFSAISSRRRLAFASSVNRASDRQTRAWCKQYERESIIRSTPWTSGSDWQNRALVGPFRGICLKSSVFG
jgi:hypothetical protein